MVKKIMCFLLFFCVACSQPFYSDTFVISGTFLEVKSPDRKAAGIVFEEWKRLDALFNFYSVDSELSRVNVSGGNNIKVSDEFMELFLLSQDVYKLTDGYFDVSRGALYEFWKEIIAKGGVSVFPPKEVLEQFTKPHVAEPVSADSATNTIRINDPLVKLDFSGIAKGYMVDKAVQKLKEAGIENALISAGGDIYCLGTNGGKPWHVGIKKPLAIKEIIDTIPVINGAVATSGDYEQFFTKNGKRYSHLIDPKTGFPVDNTVVSVTVVAANLTTADALATAFFAMGVGGIREFLRTTPSNIKIYVLTDDGLEKHVYIF